MSNPTSKTESQERAEISCETQGHFWGPGAKCVFCEALKTEPRDARVEILRDAARMVESYGRADMAICLRAIIPDIEASERLQNELTEAKRQRNDEQRLRLAAERSRVETPTELCGDTVTLYGAKWKCTKPADHQHHDWQPPQVKTGVTRTDTQRLNELEALASQGDCPGIINDDNGHWAVSGTGMQSVSAGPQPADTSTAYFVPGALWRNSIREAIDDYLDDGDDHDDHKESDAG